MLVVAFFFALGGVIAVGNGNLIGVVMFLIAALLAVSGWSLWGYRRGPD
jgi:hypothetical protein